MSNVSEKTSRLAKMALLAAISVVLVVATGWIAFPPAPFLKYDAAVIPILLATFAYGPLAGLSITFVVSAVQAFFLGGDGIIGFCMHMLATGSFIIIAGCLYRSKKTKKRAVLGLVLGVLGMTVMMLLWNLIVTPFYMGVPREAVLAMLVPIFLPFNLLKGAINAVITFIIYKPLSRVLHEPGAIRRKERPAVAAAAVEKKHDPIEY